MPTTKVRRKRAPFDWLNDHSRTFLQRGYLLEGTSPEERVRDIADRAEEILGIDGFGDRFFDYMSRGYYSLASPVWANFGLDRGLPISCFGSYIGDSMEAILDTHAEVGMMTKVGGGTSGYFGDIRPRGSEITNNGTSNGTYPFAQLFDKIINVVSQGETRRGHFAGYIDIEHPDIEEWLNIQTEGDTIQTMYYGVVVGDDWMQQMIDGDADKRALWAKVIEARMNLGIPYILFRDNVNNNKPQVYKDKDYDIKASNLCITGDQRVVSDRGYLTAKELHDQGGRLTLFDGEKAVSASRMKLREESADVYKITLANGLEHKVTAYHGLPVYQGRGEYKRVEAQDIEEGDCIVIQKKKGLFGDTHAPKEALLAGLYQSDGTQTDERIMLDVWEQDVDILEEVERAVDYVYNVNGLNEYEVSNQHGPTGKTRTRATPRFRDCMVAQSTVKKRRLASSVLKQTLSVEKGTVPSWVWTSDEETQWAYVRGLLLADGTAHMSESKGNPVQIAYADINRSFLQELQLLFNNLGLSSQIRLLRKGGTASLPDGKGGHRDYETKDCWRLIVGNKPAALEIEKKTGFLSRKGIDLEDRVYRNNTKKAYAVESIEYVGKEPVYCPTVDTEQHVFVAQGMLTFNCSEIALPSNAKESFVCCLSSMNVLHYDEWKETDAVETLTFFLDAVMQEFIDRASGTKHMERAVRFAERHRAIGIGMLGWHSYLQDNMIPFESTDANLKGAEVAKTIKERSYAASSELADRFGEPEVLEGYGRRNTTTMAVAPTKSSSFILGQVSPSIEPIKSNYFVQDRAKMKVTYKNPYLKEVLAEKGADTEAMWDKIALRDGSVQHLDILSQHEKDVFKTFSEIGQMTIINQAASRQKHIDQSQSLNLAIDPGSTAVKDINALYIEAWRKGVKSLYYQNGVNAAQSFSRELLECRSCEG
ncbi:MAG: LAGLIDADG family homing endonuclease [Longimonas sp.]|uniref:LAGLIDADG family homing endonuclease n=1 Tax=Longimonas sp. TaxID=2039626 RepID=UPI00335E239F